MASSLRRTRLPFPFFFSLSFFSLLLLILRTGGQDEMGSKQKTVFHTFPLFFLAIDLPGSADIMRNIFPLQAASPLRSSPFFTKTGNGAGRKESGKRERNGMMEKGSQQSQDHISHILIHHSMNDIRFRFSHCGKYISGKTFLQVRQKNSLFFAFREGISFLSAECGPSASSI